MGNIKPATVRNILFKLKKTGIIKKITGGYVLNSPNKALSALDNVTLLGPTPSPPLVVPHQGRFKIAYTLDELSYNLILRKLTRPKKGDRAQIRVYRGDSINVSISKDRKAIFYLTGPDYVKEIGGVFGRDCLEFLLRQKMDMGVATPLDHLMGIKLKAAGLSVETDRSQLAGGEVCVHGDADKVKAFTNNLLKETLDYTVFEGKINDKITELRRGQASVGRALLSLAENIEGLQSVVNQLLLLFNRDEKEGELVQLDKIDDFRGYM